MAISSVGVGSGILTQSVLDQLRKADEAQRITPITLSIANENDKQSSLAVIDASMTNFIDSINALKDATLFNGRSATVTSGTSVSVSATANSDIQDFTLNVTQLAKKQVSESGAFTASTDKVSTGGLGGTLTLTVGSGTPVNIAYDSTTSLADLKKLINDNAGTQVNATILQTSATESHLVLSAVDEGAKAITITDSAGGDLNSNLLTANLTDLQTGQGSKFTFNGGTTEILRDTNTVTDLISGYTINLKELGSSSVSVVQDTTNIHTKIDSFVEKYNSAITELNKQTLSSTDSASRGIFSGESTIKSMKSAIQNMIQSVGGGVGSLEDYGFSVDRDGKMSVDKTVFDGLLSANASNVEAFFNGGTYTKTGGSQVTLTGAFVDMSSIVTAYTKTNGILDQLKSSISTSITDLEDRKTSATASLDSKYAILKKQFIAYDAVINKINNTSSLFTKLTSTSTNSSSN